MASTMPGTPWRKAFFSFSLSILSSSALAILDFSPSTRAFLRLLETRHHEHADLVELLPMQVEARRDPISKYPVAMSKVWAISVHSRR